MQAHVVSAVPTPAQAVIRPRFEIVDIASIFFASVCDTAIRDAAIKVNPPINAMNVPTGVPAIRGASLIRI